MPPKSIVMVGPMPPQVGGIETFVFNLMNSDLVQKHDITLIDISKPRLTRKPEFQTLSGYKRCFGRGLDVLAMSYSYSFMFFIKFLWNLVSKRIDIVHLHTASYTSFWEKCAYIMVAKAFHKKVIIHMHASRFEFFYNESPVLLKKWIAYFLSRCDHVIVLSKSWHRFYTRFLDASKIKLVNNGIDLTERNHIPAKCPRPRIVFLGEVGRRKGIYDLIESARILEENGLKVDYDIIGPGELIKAKKRVADVGLTGQFHFHGPLSGQQKFNILSKCWIMALPSYAEGMPLAILESMAAGCTIVSSRVGGIPEVIEHGKHGYLFKAGDAEQCAHYISRLIKNRSLLIKLSHACFERVRAYDIKVCAHKIDQIYQDIEPVSDIKIESLSNHKVLA